MSVSYIKLFNQNIDEFFEEIIEMFPTETRIRVNYSLFQSICKSNAKKPCNDFMTNSIPYLNYIAMRDEKFFTGKNTPEFLLKFNFTDKWNGLSDNTKNNMWKYMQNCFAIGINVVEMPPETLPLINYIINFNILDN